MPEQLNTDNMMKSSAITGEFNTGLQMMFSAFMDSLAQGDTSDLAELTEHNMCNKIRNDLSDLEKQKLKLKLIEGDTEQTQFFVLENSVYTGAVLPYRNLNHTVSYYEIKQDEYKKHPLYYYVHFKEYEELD